MAKKRSTERRPSPTKNDETPDTIPSGQPAYRSGAVREDESVISGRKLTKKAEETDAPESDAPNPPRK